MKKHLFLLTLLVALLPVVANAEQRTVTIGDWSGSNSGYYTLGSYYHYSYSQTIYSSSQLGDDAGYIRALTFDNRSTAALTYDSIKVYIGYCTDTAFGSTSAWVAEADLTLVYEDTAFNIPAETGELTMLLDTPFQYNGTGNIVIAIRKWQPNYSNSCKVGYTTKTNTLMYRQSDSDVSYANHPGSTAGTRSTNQANLKLLMTTGATDDICLSPQGLSVSNVTPYEATVSWNLSSDYSDYSILYSSTAIDPTTTSMTPTTTTGNTILLDNLDPNTVYYVYLQATCLSGNSSDWVMTTFRTACVAVPTDSLPYTYGFEDATGTSATATFNPCYGRYCEGTTTNYPYPTATHNSGTKGLYMYSAASVHSWLTLPQFEEDLTDLQLSFYAYRSTTATYGHYAVGVMSNPSDITTFDTLLVGQVSANSLWELVEVPLANYTGNGTYLAILCPKGSAANYTYIDDITVDYLPTCLRPMDLVQTDTTSNTATLEWTANASEYIVEYGLAGFVQGQGDTLIVTTNSITFTGLTMGLTYGVYVTSICSDDTSSAAYGTVTAGCANITADDLPFMETFETYGSGAAYPISACWNKGTNGSTAYPYPYSTNAINGNRSLYFYSYYPSSATTVHSFSWVALPEVDESLEMSDLMVTFKAKRYATTTSYYNSYIHVGIAESLDDFNTAGIIDSAVTWIDTIDLTALPASTIEDEEVSFENYDGDGHYVVFYSPVPALTGSNTYAYNYIYLDDIALRAIPSCFWPTEVSIDSIAADAVTISWTPDPRTPSPSYWTVEYGNVGFVPGEGTTEIVYDTTAVLTELLADHNYEIHVFANCGADESDPAVISVHTACAPIATEDLPYIEDFEDYTSGSAYPISPCWTKHAFNTTTQYPYPSTTAGISGSIGLYFYCYGSSNISEYAALPLFESDINDLMVSFYAKRYSSTTASYHSMVQVGVMSNPNDISTFELVEEIDLTPEAASSIHHFVISLEGYTGTGRYIAFYTPAPTVSSHYNYIYLDSIVVDALPSCRWPASLAVDNVTDESIEFSFVGDETATFHAVVSAGGVDVDSANFSTNSYTFTGLLPQTTYTIRVATVCGNDMSSWSTVSATTACGAITTLPWIEDFDSFSATSSATDIPCWVHFGGGYVNFYTTSGSHLYSGTSLRFYPNSSTAGNIVVLPIFEEPVSTLEISLMAKPEGTSSGSFSVGYVTNPTDSSTFVEVTNYPLSHFQVTPGATTVSYVLLTNTFAGAPEGSRIALRHNVGSTAWYWFIDSINVHLAPSCLPVSSLTVDNTTSNSISISFNGVEGGTFGVAITDGGIYYDTATITGTSHTFVGLNANTEYTINVTTICSFGNSGTTSVAARTRCAPIATLPYIEDFEAYSSGSSYGIDPCWNKGTNNTTQYPYPYSTNAVNGQRSLYFYAYHPSTTSSTAYYCYAALPEFQDSVNSLMLSFNVRRYSTTTDYYTTRLVIGVMTDPEDISTFTPVDTLDLKTAEGSSVHGYECYFNNYTGTGKFIAIYDEVPPLYGSATYSYSYAYVDDITVDYIPSCMRPTNVTVNNIGQNTATVHWTSTAPSFEIEYGPHGFTQGMGTVVTSVVDSVDLYGLNPSTQYDVYVRALCTASDISYWSFVTTFSTECGPISLPAFFDPDNYATGTSTPLPTCWTRTNNATGTVNYYPYVYSSSANAHTGNNVLYYYFSTSSGYANDEMIVFPEIDVTTFPMAGNEVVFYAKSSVVGKKFYVGVMTNPNDATTFVAADSVVLNTVSSEYTVDFTGYTGTGSYIALRGVMEGSSSYYIYVDDILIEQVSPCPRSYDLTAMNGTPTTVDLAWTDTIGSTQWKVSYALLTGDTWTDVLVNTNPYTLTGLTANTNYRYRVAPICADGQQADWSRETYAFSTSQASLATMPYSYDYEAAGEWANWQTNSNNSVNWYRGTVAQGNSTNSMYLSTDNGATHSWNMNIITNAVAYRDIDFGSTTGSYTLTFDAYVGGTVDHNYDGLSVLVVDPADYVDASSTGLTSPWGNVNNVGLGTVRHDTAWGSHTIYLDGMTGVRRLVFYHFNQATGSSYAYQNNPTAIDNIVITQQTCARPYDLEMINVTSNSATISWSGEAGSYTVSYRVAGDSINSYLNVTGNSAIVTGLTANTSYYIWVRRNCSDSLSSAWSSGVAFTTPCVSLTLPYYEDFNSVTASTYNTEGVLPDCWDAYSNGTSDIYMPHVVGSGSYWYSPDTTNSLTMTSGSATYGDTKIVALPQFDMSVNGDTLSFVYRYENATNGSQLYVGYVTNDDYANSFVSVSAITPTTTLTTDTVVFSDIPANATRIAFKWVYTTSFYSVGIDNVSVWGGLPHCQKPTNLIADTSSYNSLAFAWNDSDSSEVVLMDGLWDVASYNPANAQIVTTGNIVFDGLMYNHQYTLGVRTLCEAENSEWSILTVNTADLPCIIPGMPVVSNVSYSTADITWATNGIETAWEVHVFNTAFDRYDTVTNNPTYTATGLTSGMTYNVAVSALCGANYERMSEASDTVSFTMQTCAVPTNVTVTGVTANSATVSWNSTGATKYEIEYGFSGYNQGEGTSAIVEGATSYTITGLSQNTEYDVYVRAFCSETLVSSWSDAQSFTTTQTGISDVMNSNVSLYPNPASQTVTVSGIEGEATVSIVDLNGREVYSTTANGTVTVDVTGYAQGAYFVRIAGENTVAIRKLIVK